MVKDVNTIELSYPRFVDINGRFGLDQAMLGRDWSKYYVARSCALSALGNCILYSLGKYTLSEEEALEFFNKLMQVLRPMPWGVPSIRRLNQALQRLEKYLGQGFQIKIHRGKNYGPEAFNFIFQNLQENRPILLLNTNHPKRGFQNHWVTITGLLFEEGKYFVYFSSWGKRYKMLFEDLLTDQTIFRRMGVLERK